MPSKGKKNYHVEKERKRSQSPKRRSDGSSVGSKAITEVVPTLVYIKSKQTSNVSAWEKKLEIYLGAKYGRGADFLKAGAKYIPPGIPDPAVDAFDQTHDPHGVKRKVYQRQVTTREEEIIRREAQYVNIYHEIRATWSRDSEELIMQDSDYAAAEAASCPVLLMPIWRRTHRQPLTGALVLDEDTGLERYYLLKQESRSLTQHKKDFDDAIDILAASGSGKPTDEQQAARFVKSLDPNRYGQWLAELENQTKAGLDVWPKTLPEAYSRAFTLKKVSHDKGQPTVDASIFVTNGRKDKRQDKAKVDRKDTKKTDDSRHGDKPKRACKICKGVDHLVWNCPHLDQCADYVKNKTKNHGATDSGIDGVHVGSTDRLSPTDFVVLSVVHTTESTPSTHSHDDMPELTSDSESDKRRRQLQRIG